MCCLHSSLHSPYNLTKNKYWMLIRIEQQCMLFFLTVSLSVCLSTVCLSIFYLYFSLFLSVGKKTHNLRSWEKLTKFQLLFQLFFQISGGAKWWNTGGTRLILPFLSPCYGVQTHDACLDRQPGWVGRSGRWIWWQREQLQWVVVLSSFLHLAPLLHYLHQNSLSFQCILI